MYFMVHPPCWRLRRCRCCFFTFDPTTQTFLLTTEQVQVSVDTQEFAINSSNQRHWENPVKRYIDELLAGKTSVREKDFNMRWVACMVGDIHRILCRGGIFSTLMI